MSRIRSANTQPELTVRKWLASKGYRFKIHYPVTGKPDIAFPKKKIAVFIHGCFWHGHNCKYFIIPKTNRNFWLKKIFANKKRDLKVSRQLRKNGWKVIKIWEHEIEQKPDKIFTNLKTKLSE